MIAEFIVNEQYRADVYRLFAALFYPPDLDTLLEEGVCDSLKRLVIKTCPAVEDHARGMCNAILSADAEQLKVAHAKLFVGPFELQAPPYGSVYLEENKRLMGDTTIDVMKMYEQAGLSLNDDNRDAPDHISIELEFMHYLVCREIQALRAGNSDQALEYLQMQHAFNYRYLRPWVPPFAERIRVSSQAEFYKLLAMSLHIYITNVEIPGTVPAGAEVL